MVLPPSGARPRQTQLPASPPEPKADPNRGLCGSESSETCSVLRDGRLTLQRPKVADADAVEACKGGGRVYFLDGLEKGRDGPVTKESAKALSDEVASDSIQQSLARAREIARQSGCSAVTVRQAKGEELAGAYSDPKAVAIIHVGHGNQGTGHPVSADQLALQPDSLDASRVSKRLKTVENVVCEGGKDAAGFEKVLPPGVKFHGVDHKITTADAKKMVEGEVADRLQAALGKK